MKNMTMRQRWARSFGPTKEVWKLEEHGPLALFETKDEPNDDPLGRKPMFHVWKGDAWLYCGPDMTTAYDIYNKETATA